MPDNPEVLSHSDTQPVASITVNQFIQLVNKNNALPDGEALDRYTAEDKAWIKQRTEVEQEARHQLMHKLVENEHAVTLQVNAERNKSRKHSQNWAGAVILIAMILGVALVCLGYGAFGLGFIAVIMIPSVASGIADHVIKKTKAGSESEK